MTEPAKDAAGAGNENFVVQEVAGEAEESDKDDKAGKDSNEKSTENNKSDGSKNAADDQAVVEPETSSSKPGEKPNVPVVDCGSKSAEEETMETEMTEPAKDAAGAGNKNFVVLEVAGEAEESDKNDKAGKDSNEKSTENNESDGGKYAAGDQAVKPKTSSSKPEEEPNVPVVDCGSKSAEEETMETEMTEPAKDAAGAGNEKFVVLEVAGEFDKNDKAGKDSSEKNLENNESDGSKNSAGDQAVVKSETSSSRPGEKPNMPVVDCVSVNAEEETVEAEMTEPAKDAAGADNENFVVQEVAGESEISDKNDKAGKDSSEKTIKNNESDGGKQPAGDQAVVKSETSSSRPGEEPNVPVVDCGSKNAEEETMEAEMTEPATDPAGADNENFVVLEVAGEADDKAGKDSNEKSTENNETNDGKTPAEDQAVVKSKTSSSRLRKTPSVPAVDVGSMRKRKWCLIVYPLHTDDLQLDNMNILCKLASESLLYIPSDHRHGKAELYVATHMETATIVGKVLRMGFHHNMLSIKVVQKGTEQQEDGTESMKMCKAFLTFDTFLSKKLFDAKKEKGPAIEKIVTLTNLPNAATKDFIKALFPFATEIDIYKSDNPGEGKAIVTCKTPITSLLVYMSFKRLEINGVHVNISVDKTVKAISLPSQYLFPPTKEKDTGRPNSVGRLYQSSLRKRPGIHPQNRRSLPIKKRTLLKTPKLTRRQTLRDQMPNQGFPVEEELRTLPYHHTLPPRHFNNHQFEQDMMQGPWVRDYPMGRGHRRIMNWQNDRWNRDSNSRGRNETDSHVEESQNFEDHYSVAETSYKPSLRDHGPRHFRGESQERSSPIMQLDYHQSGFDGASLSSDHGDRINRGIRNESSRPDRLRSSGDGRVNRPNRPDKRMDTDGHMDNQQHRHRKNSRDRNGKGDDAARYKSKRQPRASGGGASSDVGGNKGDRSSLSRSHGSQRTVSNGRRGHEFTKSDRSTQRNDRTTNSASRGSAGYDDYSQGEGDNSYFRHY